MIDQASQITIDYLSILEERLRIEWDDSGTPITTPAHFNHFSLQMIQRDIYDLFRGETFSSALIAARAFSRDYKQVQTVGFGLVDDFDTFVKVGFMCGERLVLWDYLWGRIIGSGSWESHITKDLISRVACNLVSLIPIAASGGLVILPHPSYWSEAAQRSLRELDRTNYNNPVNQGLVSSLSVIEEIPLHPYTIFQEWPDHPEGLTSHKYFSPEHSLFHQFAYSLIQDSRFAYLRNISAAEFYEHLIMTSEKVNKPFYDQLKQRLNVAGTLSPEEISNRFKSLRDEIADEIESRNRNLIKSSAVKAGAAISYMTAVGTLLNSVTLGDPRSTVALAAAGLGGAFLQFLSETLERRSESILIQAFYEAKTAVPGVRQGI